MRKLALYTILLSVILFTSCESDNIPDNNLIDENIEIQLSIPNYNISYYHSATRATSAGSAAEQVVANLYLFLFPGTGNTTGTLARYYIEGATFAGGTYDSANNKVTLSMTRAEAGLRDVYIVANVSPALKNQLDVVTTISELSALYDEETAQPWSSTLSTPILMSGNKTHDFVANQILGEGGDNTPVSLIRALAKIELNIMLNSGFQVNTARLDEYKYRYVDFDTRTYILKQNPTKPNNSVSSSVEDSRGWLNTERIAWGSSLNGITESIPGSGYTETSGNVTGLRLITYLNERDNLGAKIEIELPRVDDGPLPPPEFGPELYSLPLPEKVERNNWYVYDIDI